MALRQSALIFVLKQPKDGIAQLAAGSGIATRVLFAPRTNSALPGRLQHCGFRCSTAIAMPDSFMRYRIEQRLSGFPKREPPGTLHQYDRGGGDWWT